MQTNNSTVEGRDKLFQGEIIFPFTELFSELFDCVNVILFYVYILHEIMPKTEKLVLLFIYLWAIPDCIVAVYQQ